MVKKPDQKKVKDDGFTEPSPEASIDREALVRDLERVSPLHRLPLEQLTQTLDAFEELATLATEANLRQVNAQHEFEELLNQLTDCRTTPDRPQSFSFAAISSGRPNNPPTPVLPQFNFRHPCFLPPFLFGQIADSLLRRIMPLSSPNAAAKADDMLWIGLWTAFDFAEQLRPLEVVFNAGRRLDRGLISLDRFQRIASIAASSCGISRPQAFSHTMNFSFPVPGSGPSFINPCRLDQWNETERAVRCFCIETYHIERIQNCTDDRDAADYACVGDCIDIFGSAFGNERSWGSGDRMSDVLFPTASGDLVAASNYLPIPAENDDNEIPSGWSDSRIRVQVPENAVQGEIEIRVLCRRTSGGRPIDQARCRYPTRLPSGNSDRFLLVIGTPSISFQVIDPAGDHFDVVEGRTTMFSEACNRVDFRITATFAESVSLTDETGNEIPLVDIDPSILTFRALLSRDDNVDKTFTLTVNNRCLDTPIVRTIEIHREYKVTVIPRQRTVIAGTTTELYVRVSCPLESGGVVSVTPDLEFSGIELPGGSDISIPPGSDRSANVPVITSPFLCGGALLTGHLTSGSTIPHVNGTALIDVPPIDITTMVTASMRGIILPPIFDVEQFREEAVATFPATFSADRTRLTLILPGTINVNTISFSAMPTTIIANYNGASSAVDFPLTAEIGAPVPFSGGTISMTLSSTGDLRGEFGPFGPTGNRLGMQSRTDAPATFSLTVVGAGTVVGGTADGTRLGIGLRLNFPIRPPRYCNLEPWFDIHP